MKTKSWPTSWWELASKGEEGRVQAGFRPLCGVSEAAQSWRSSLTGGWIFWVVGLHVNDGEEQARQLSFFAPRPSGKHVLLLGSQPPRKHGGPVPAGRPQDLKAKIAPLSHLHWGRHPWLPGLAHLVRHGVLSWSFLGGFESSHRVQPGPQ